MRSVQDRVQSIAPLFGVVEAVVWGSLAVIFSPLYRTASDNRGRRFAVLPPLVGSVVSSTTVFAVVYLRAPVYWLLVKDVAYGCCGGCNGSSAMTTAYNASIGVSTATARRRMIRLKVAQMATLIPAALSPVA